MSEVTLREYRTGDAEAMYALDVLCFDPVFQFSRRAMRYFAEAKRAVTILAEAQSELVGFCIAEVEDEAAYVVTLDVAPEWRRRGLARRLMIALESKAGATGAKSISLHVFKGNTGAVRFYESMGYGRVSMVESFYGRGLDALVYRKRLEP
ncbi:MAG TPA: GNAT family N-acetyltransferase [Acidobacteriaceae bacterium]